MNQKRKPKEIIYNIDFGRNVKGEFVELPNGGLAFKEDGKPLIPVSAQFTMSQDRENKDPKVIIDIPMDPENISFYLGFTE